MNRNEHKNSFSIERIKTAAQGRINEILRHVAGIPDEILEQDKREHPCPLCGGDTRCRLIDREAGAIFCSHCFSEGNGDFIEAVRHFRAVDRAEALRLIAEHLGITSEAPAASGQTTPKQLAGTWVYPDQAGAPLYRVKRFEWIEMGKPKKEFFQERYVDGKWVLGLKGVEPVPYNWAAITASPRKPIYIVEGEKCADALIAWKLPATTASGGSNSKLDWSKYLAGRDVVIFPDNDKPGHEYALRVADQLHQAGRKIKVVFLPGLAPKGDVADWIAAGGTRDELRQIVKETPIWDGRPFSYQGDGKDSAPPAAGEKKSTGFSYVPKLINPEHVKSVPIQWLWENKIPLEMITVFAGRQGGGKTFWSCFLAAVITNGWKWPDGTDSPMGSVLFFYGEDLIDKTMIPRLKAQGADLSKIRILDGFTEFLDGKEVGEMELTLKAVEQIRGAINATEQETGLPVRLVVVDPVSNHWGGVKENDNAQVREVLKPIQRLAGETGASFLLITHFGKRKSPSGGNGS